MCFQSEALCDFGQGIKLPELPFASLAKVTLNEQCLIYLEGGLNGNMRMSLAQSWANSKPPNWQRTIIHMLLISCYVTVANYPFLHHHVQNIALIFMAQSIRAFSCWLLLFHSPLSKCTGMAIGSPIAQRDFIIQLGPVHAYKALLTVFSPCGKLLIT